MLKKWGFWGYWGDNDTPLPARGQFNTLLNGNLSFGGGWGFLSIPFLFIKNKEFFMKKITNIYILVDCSQYMQGRPILKARQALIKYIRALAFSKSRVNFYILGYNDRTFKLNPQNQIFTVGNPNLGEVLKQLYYLLATEKKTDIPHTRSIFMLHTSGLATPNWSHTLNMLFNKKEFAFAHRYVITYGKSDGVSKRALSAFVDTEDKILPYFSERRLCSLVESITL